MSTISAGTTTGTALVNSGDTTGQLVLQTNGTTTAVTIGTNQVVTLAQPLPVTSGGTGSTTGLNLASAVTGTLGVANGGTGSTSLTANNVLLGNGTSAVQVVAPGTAGNVLTSNGTTWQSTAPAPSAGSITASASGSIANGKPVVVNSNGTVSEVAATPVPFSVGSLVGTFSGGISYSNSCSVYHPLENKYLFFNSSGGGANTTVWIGTVTGTSISFTTQSLGSLLMTSISAVYVSGTNRIYLFGADGINGPSVYTLSLSGSTITNHGRTGVGGGSPVSFNYQSAIVYDSANNRLYCFYDNQSGSIDFGFATPGTTSVTSPTFGYQVVGTNATYYNAYYDPSAQRILVLYRDGSNWGQSRVINGATVGSAVAFNSGSTNGITTAAYDSVAAKWLICFGDQSIAGGRPSGIVATVGSTAATFGTKVQMGETASGNDFWSAYSSTAGLVGVVYANGSAIRFRTGTISGNSVSFSSANTVVNLNESVFFQLINVPSSSRFVMNAYGNGTGSVGAYGAVIQADVTTYNITSTNFIGFSDGTYTNGQTATVKTVGGTTTAQSGLTAGSAYYVINTGAISTTAGSPSVFAGTAVSATTLLVKG